MNIGWGFLTKDVSFRAGRPGWSEHTKTYTTGTPVLVTSDFDPATPPPTGWDAERGPDAPQYRRYTLYRHGLYWQAFRLREDVFPEYVRLDPAAECDRRGHQLNHDNAAPADSDGRRGAERMYR